jgi:3-oxoacyl-[acyl-carrier-protein] synthase-3
VRSRRRPRVTDVDYIVLATMTPDYLSPGSGVRPRRLDPRFALDIRQQRRSVRAPAADGLVATGAARTILVVGARRPRAGFSVGRLGRAEGNAPPVEGRARPGDPASWARGPVRRRRALVLRRHATPVTA